jgi:hypothetical protein
MVEHKCPICKEIFNKKSRYIEHLSKKKQCVIKCYEIKEEKTQKIKAEKIYFPTEKTHIYAEIPHNYTEINQKIDKNNKEEQIICKYCMKQFCRKDVLTRHILNNCKIKKKQDDEKEVIFRRLLLQENLLKEKDEQINKLISQNDVLISKINVLENKVDKISYNKENKNTINNVHNSTNTINTNNGIIIQLVNYGKEDLDKIDIKHYINNIVKNNKISGVKIPEEILKLIHFNPSYPELNNIYISDINREKCMIYDDGMWKLSGDDKIPEVIDKVVLFSYEKENELREKFPNNKPLIDRLNIINKYNKLTDIEYLEELKDKQLEDIIDNKIEIKRCEEFQKKTYDTFKNTFYNEGFKIKKNIKK